MTEGHRPSRLPRRRPVTKPAAPLAGIVAVLMAVAACTSSGTAGGRFTPANFEALSADDQDLGSTEPAQLPGGLIFQVGKEGVGYVLDGTRLAGTGGELTSSEVCEGGSASGSRIIVPEGDQVVSYLGI